MASAASKRLLKELAASSNDLNPALEYLRPVNDNDLFTWEGSLLGVDSTPYQGIVH